MANFMQQTHFAGVLPPEHISLTLQNCRRYMNEKYGCKSGHSTPIHVTLIPPFCLPKEFSSKDLTDSLEEKIFHINDSLAFTAAVDGFSAFADRTIFAKVVPSEEWVRLRDLVLSSVLSVASSCTKKDKRPFQPHLTVANRDIPEGASTKALQVLSELNLKEEFLVDNVTVFERKANQWIPVFSCVLEQK